MSLLRSWRFGLARRLYKYSAPLELTRFVVSLTHQIEFMKIWLMREHIDIYDLESTVNMLLASDVSDAIRLEFLKEVQLRVEAYRGPFRDIDRLRQRMTEA